jgi:hypothetical protein
VTVNVDEHRAVAAHPHAAGSMNSGIVLGVDQRSEITREKFVQSGL